MRLYMSVNSPYARFVRVLLREIGATDAVAETAIDPRDSGTGFWARNPIAKIPALELADGTVIAESSLICRYLDAHLSEGRLHAPLSADPARMSLMGVVLGMLDRGVAARVEKLRIGEGAGNAYIGTQLAAVMRGCDWLDRAAPEPGGDPDMLDIAASCAVDWIGFRHPELDLRTGRPRLMAWVDTMAGRPSMRATRPD